MNARAALFDLYGDHLRQHDDRAPVAALVRLLSPLGVGGPAVRTAVSRMVRQGWLVPERLSNGPGYTLTDRARRRLDEAAARIYRTRNAAWDGQWHLLVLEPVRDRSARDRVRAGLRFLGYAPLRDDTWLSARESEEVDFLLALEDVRVRRFSARHEGDPAALAASAWDLEGLARAYRRWLIDAERIISGARVQPTVDDERAFAVRSQLVHEWRKFLFRDPGLPRELLPARWPGDQAAALFDTEATRLLPGARRFVGTCLDGKGQPR